MPERDYGRVTWCSCVLSAFVKIFISYKDPEAAAPLPFTPGNPALCGSRPLVTPYYCSL